MRSILIGMVVAAGFTLVGTAPTLAAPATGAVISQAAAEISPLTQVPNGPTSQYKKKKPPTTTKKK